MKNDIDDLETRGAQAKLFVRSFTHGVTEQRQPKDYSGRKKGAASKY